MVPREGLVARCRGREGYTPVRVRMGSSDADILMLERRGRRPLQLLLLCIAPPLEAASRCHSDLFSTTGSCTAPHHPQLWQPPKPNLRMSSHVPPSGWLTLKGMGGGGSRECERSHAGVIKQTCAADMSAGWHGWVFLFFWSTPVYLVATYLFPLLI